MSVFVCLSTFSNIKKLSFAVPSTRNFFHSNSVTHSSWKLHRATSFRALHGSNHDLNTFTLSWPIINSQLDKITVKKAISLSSKWLAGQNVIEPTISASEILAKVKGYRGAREMREALLQTHPAFHTEIQCREFERLCKLRSTHMPLQYIMGEWDWHELELIMRPNILIPRPETEELVERVLEWIKNHDKWKHEKSIHFLDVGTGTGAIGLALLKKLPTATCVGCDISKDAVDLSLENAVKVGVQDRYSCVLSEIRLLSSLYLGQFHFIISNPPYIPEKDMIGLDKDVREFEDWGALCGGDDGMKVIREVISSAPDLLLPSSEGGFNHLWLEVDSSHPAMLENLKGIKRIEDVEWFRDMGGHPRFVALKFKDKIFSEPQ